MTGSNRMQLRPSRVLAKLRAGETAVSLKLNLSDARVAEMAARLSGVDCLFADLEHVPNDLGVIEQQIWASKAYDVDVLVRVPRGSYSDITRPLEMDAAGIMIPHVMGVADAQAMIRSTKFYPLGLRALDGGNADGAYSRMALADYMREANEQRFVVLQIEDPEPLEELDALMALPGFDMVFFGPGDFAQAIGAPGHLDHPRVAEARRAIAGAARKHGKFAGTVGSLANRGELEAMGYSFLNIGADVVGLGQYLETIRQELG